MTDQDSLVAQFVDTTSSTPEFARSFLDMASWNLQDALELFWGGGGGGGGAGGGGGLASSVPNQPSAGASSHACGTP